MTGTANYTTPFSSSNANINNPKINFFGCDGFCTNDHYVRYLHTVDANNDSVGVVEFCTGTYNSTTRSNLYRWQVQLYHNGNIVIVYGPAPNETPNVTRQQGLCVSSSDGWIVNASDVATHFTSGLSTTIPTRTWPSAGRYYSFQAPVMSCPRPLTISVSDLTTSSFTFSWVDTSSVSAWIVRLAAGDSVIYDNMEYASPVYFSGLTPNTD